VPKITVHGGATNDADVEPVEAVQTPDDGGTDDAVEAVQESPAETAPPAPPTPTPPPRKTAAASAPPTTGLE